MHGATIKLELNQLPCQQVNLSVTELVNYVVILLFNESIALI